MTNDIVQMQIPMWGAGSEWFWAFWQFIAVVLTLVLIWKQVKQQTESHKSIEKQVKLQTKEVEIQTASHVVQTVCTIQERWCSETMQRVRLEVCTEWENGKRDFDGACEYIACFFEELGTFVKIKAIPIETMWDMQSWNIEYYWGMFKTGILKIRKNYKEPVYSDFEGLFRVMREISDAKGAPSVDEASLDEFVKREIRATKACLEINKKKGCRGSDS